jgi:hypothetical protein
MWENIHIFRLLEIPRELKNKSSNGRKVTRKDRSVKPWKDRKALEQTVQLGVNDNNVYAWQQFLNIV